ncbi:secreted RxLR effector protein 161-like [Vitis vinifera]|uniref:secreted RxLR effector protein 161-like n=1 Tax=Vitis vinifera TaxID=29760 RepID=UPI0028834894|nr:secreted RxLR effector protein 161-like [Vitis vinifera]
MPTNLKLSKDESGKEVNETLYRSMIGSLLYLTASRLDIAFSVGVCARYQACPKESHLIALKYIIRYIAGTLELGLWYAFDTYSDVACYTDADWAGNVDDRKNTSGGCFYIGNCLVAWMSKKQNFVSLSTAKAEYIVAAAESEPSHFENQPLPVSGLSKRAASFLMPNFRFLLHVDRPICYPYQEADIR